MGVPKFFRYTSERYPCLNELVKQYQIPDFDNMYLDMNGIIHNCSHPDDSNPHFRITEEKIFNDIFHYISILFQIIKPKKLFFMAIDGVAPRAKMNQQRGRRFRSAKEAEKLEEEAKSKGETLPTEKRFDSNCITPGTVFMARLHEQLRYFVKQKISTDPLWAKVQVILSGHETPGEGEHKIMDYIRWLRSQPGYDPNTRHCLYGLDADLIMLGMCTHEPHFALLREEVKFGKTTQRATSPEETNFYLLHLCLLREYLEQEFIELKDKLPFKYDLEKIVDDWVLMGFLVGNDFIPNLPNMHIGNDALPILYRTYVKVLPTLDGYINEAGDLNLARFEVFMQELAKLDREKFQESYTDLKYFEGKTGRRPNPHQRKEYKPNDDDTFNVNIDAIKSNKPDDELQELIRATQLMYMNDVIDEDALDGEDYEDTSDEEATFEQEFKLHKTDYYTCKLDYSKVTDEVLVDQAEGYVRAIQWNLYYYYKGCPSWCWYYPHHYAPFMSDIKGFKDLKIEFELGEPFKPFEQLLAVLPAASKNLLPTPFHDLMTEENSPIVHYYPEMFETDLNGKKNDWEAVVLIPFINEANLLAAMLPCYQRLTDEERKRNTHGPMLVYNWSSKSKGVARAPEYFPPIPECHATETAVWRNELDVPEGELRRGVLPNANSHMLFPGFPTTRHLKYKAYLKSAKVKVFELPSRCESMLLQLINNEEAESNLEKVALELLGKEVWVGWPHLTKAKVISVSSEKKRLHYVNKHNDKDKMGQGSYTTEDNVGNLHKQWISERATIHEHNFYRLGIELGDVNIIVHALNLKGYKYVVESSTSMVSEPEWCSVACGYALQAVVRDVSEWVRQTPTRYSTPAEAYPPGDRVFLLTPGPYYGCSATILASGEPVRNGRIKVQVCERAEPTPAINQQASPYHTATHAAAAAGISSQMLSRITGTMLVVAGERHDKPTDSLNKINIGLNLKFNKKNLEVSGYTRRCKMSGYWLYSHRCIELVKTYTSKYPDLFDKLATTHPTDIFFESDLWPNDVGKNIPQEISKWLKSLPHNKAIRRECGADALEPEEMKALADMLQRQIEELKGTEKKLTLHVKWNLLYKAELHEGNISPDTSADFKMYDRVVCVACNMTVPAGATGTVTAVFPPATANTVRLSDKLNAHHTYQVMFDEPFAGAMTEELFDDARFYRMSPSNLLNISFGRKLRDAVTVINPSTNIRVRTRLRTDDGHHSAFANYSPTSDQKFSVDSDNKKALTPEQDGATELLRSLLKINTDSSEMPKKNKQNEMKPNDSWRKTGEPKPNQRASQSDNWRRDCAPSFSNQTQQQPQQQQQHNKYRGPMPNPPFPSYPRGPGYPGQMPFPPFQMPPYHHRMPGYPGYHEGQQPWTMPHHGPHDAPPRGSFNPDMRNQATGQREKRKPAPGFHGNQDNQNVSKSNTFPSHLPNVGKYDSVLGPNWMRETSKTASTSTANVSSTNKSTEKAPNPFVPLQVQTSQRRAQNTSGPSTKKTTEGLPAPKPIAPNPQPSSQAQQNVPQQAEPSSRPVKKRKPRIAANLPFHLD